MKLGRKRAYAVAALAFLAAIVVAISQWQTLARLLIAFAVLSVAHVKFSCDTLALSLHEARFEGVRIVSTADEPIATIAGLRLTYNLRDLLPGGRRLFGLESVTAQSPHITIVRHADGSFNLPLRQLPSNGGPAQQPLIVAAVVRDGSVDVTNESANVRSDRRHLFARGIEADAAISTFARSTYSVALKYGEQSDRLYPVYGRGVVDVARRESNQHWSAPQLPLASAVDFAIDSPSLRLDSGTLRNVVVDIFALPGTPGPFAPHLSGSATLTDGALALAGLSGDVTGVRGPADVYDDGILTSQMHANVAGTIATVSGGIYNLRDPQVRMSIAGSGRLSRLRTAFVQAKTLPVGGTLAFALLVEGSATKPLTWIDFRLPGIAYSGAALGPLSGFVALDAREADVVALDGSYHGATLRAHGRIGLAPKHNDVEVVAAARGSSAAIPFADRVLPGAALSGFALATGPDPKHVTARGVVAASGNQTALDGIFDLDSRGVGSVGPIRLHSPSGSAYARLALDVPHRSVTGVADVRNLTIAGVGTADATVLGSQAGSAMGGNAVARIITHWGTASAHGTVTMRDGALVGAASGSEGDDASFAAALGGTPQRPRVTGTVVVAGRRYRNFYVNAASALAFADGTLHVRDTAVALGPLFVGASGTVSGLTQGASGAHYDLQTELHSSDVSALVATVRPDAARLIQGSVDANVAVYGTGMQPAFAGTVDVPESSINGLGVRDFQGAVRGNSRSLSVQSGSAIVGSTALSLQTSLSTTHSDVSVRSARADLADFDDFFDAGDVLAGKGSFAVHASTQGTQLVASSGSADFAGARYQRLSLGNATAQWQSVGRSVRANVALQGPNGDASLVGSISPAAKAVDLRARARNVDLGTWLPMLGFNVPVSGRLNADTTLAGTYPNVAIGLHAAVLNGIAGRLPIDRFEVDAKASGGRGTIESAVLDVPSLSTVASGTFGLRDGDRLALDVHTTSADIGKFLDTVAERHFGMSAAFDSNLRVGGTRAKPELSDAVTLQALQYQNLRIPQISATLDADRYAVALRSGVIQLTKGRALLSASAPIRLTRSGVAPGTGPIAASIAAQAIDLSSFAALLPKGTHLEGLLDGSIVAGGTLDAPETNGELALRNGSFSGPIERAPISGLSGDLLVRHNAFTLQSQAVVGGGNLNLVVSAALANLRRPLDSTVNATLRADNARFDLPDYFTGNVDGSVTLARSAGDLAKVGGAVTLSKARIPVNAFLSGQSGGSSSGGLPNIAFSDLRINAGSDVRVQSANVDIGATGQLVIGGTLRGPALSGGFQSTGGTLSFYRSFVLQSGTISFDRSSGIVPDIDATASTYVPNPPTAVSLHVTGPATSMNLALLSDPSYSREQILGILVGAQQFGAVRGVNSTGGSGFSAGGAASQLALGQVNTFFTRTMLEPISASVASALGFSSVQITSDIQTGLGVNAVKAFGKNVNAIFAQTFGYPRTQSITLDARPSVATGLKLTAYTTSGPSVFAASPRPVGTDVLNLNPLTQLTPTSGTNGLTFSLEHRFP